MGIRIRLPGIILIVFGLVGMLFLYFLREGWTWIEMGVMFLVFAVGVLRTLKSG